MFNSSVSFQVLPRKTDNSKTIEIVDKVIEMIKNSGVNYEVGSMETTMEGELDQLLEIVKKAQYLCIEAGAESVFTNVKISYNPSGVMTIKEKVSKHR